MHAVRSLWEVAGATMLAGLAGAKIYYVALHWHTWRALHLSTLLDPAGLVWYGGLSAGALVVATYIKVTRSTCPPLAMQSRRHSP